VLRNLLHFMYDITDLLFFFFYRVSTTFVLTNIGTMAKGIKSVTSIKEFETPLINANIYRY
jgi:hypothetical protein